MQLEEVIKLTGLESLTNEYKEKLNRDEFIGWLKTIAGFANAKGGNFYIGIEDKTHKLIGFDRIQADNERNYLNNKITEHIVPRPQISIDFLPYIIRDKERFIIHVKVEESKLKPVILKYKGIPSIYMRREGFTSGATYEEIIEMSNKSSTAGFDTMISDISYKRENFNKLNKFYEEHNEGKKLSEKALSSLGFYDEKGMLANGAVLFMDNYQGGKTRVQCSLFAGFTRGDERIVTLNKFEGNLIDSIAFMMEFILQRMNRTIIKHKTGRMEIAAYPKRALFEAVINSVAHRDYFMDGTQIQVDMFKDRLEISSPGSFYRGEAFEKTYDLMSIISKRRNKLISDILVKCNVMEAAGTGFEKIVREYKDAGNTHRPFIYSKSDHFTLVLPDLTYEGGISESSLPVLEYIPIENGSIYDNKILSFCYYSPRKSSEIATFLGITDSSYLRSRILNNLVEQSYLLSEKINGTTYFKTNPATTILK